MIALRPYQEEARTAVLNDWGSGKKAVLLAMATGCGKTELFLSILDASMALRDRALILAHRRELIHQPVNRMAMHWPNLGRPGIVMADRDESVARVVVATVQTLNSGQRLNRLLASGPIDYLVTDEAHHAPAASYGRVYDRLFEANPQMRHLGATATPRRADDVALSEIFEKVSYKLSIAKAVELGALAPMVVYAVRIPISFDSVKTAKGDWVNKQVGDVMRCDNAEEAIVATYQEHADGKQAIAFCASVNQAHWLAQAFRDAGIKAGSADYRTRSDDRQALLDKFLAGKVQVLCNMGLWTEGVDLPNAEVALMCRPTKSDSLYVQMAGRVLRTWPGKEAASIFDFVPLGARDMRLGGDLLSGKPRLLEIAEQKAEDAGVILDVFGITKGGKGIDGDLDDIRVAVLNYFAGSRLAWTSVGAVATVSVAESVNLAVVLPDRERAEKGRCLLEAGKLDDKWMADLERVSSFRLFATGYKKSGAVNRRGTSTVEVIGQYYDWETAVAAAEVYAEEHGDPRLGAKKLGWRSQPATDSQRKWLKGLWRPGMTKGQAAQALTHKFTIGTLKRKGLL